MKAIFKGYKNTHCYDFTIGKIYELSTTPGACGRCQVTDDNGFTFSFKPGEVYDFEVIIPDSPITCSELFDDDYGYELMMNDILNKPQIDKKPELRCYINGREVDIIEFENVRFKVRQLDEDGVKCDTIKFEVKFQ